MQTKNVMKFCLVAVFVTIYAVTVRDWAANSIHLQDYNAIARLVLHANVAHLAINMYALCCLWRKPLWLIIPASMLGLLGIALSSNAVGFSATLFALMGLQWHIYDCKRNRIMIAAMLLISLLVPQLAFIAHLVPFAIALLINILWRLYSQYHKDTSL